MGTSIWFSDLNNDNLSIGEKATIFSISSGSDGSSIIILVQHNTSIINHVISGGSGSNLISHLREVVGPESIIIGVLLWRRLPSDRELISRSDQFVTKESEADEGRTRGSEADEREGKRRSSGREPIRRVREGGRLPILEEDRSLIR